ncbi:short-chain dehydrogenase, partial [Candidatus Endoriftia persephone str. Guaymas]|nr:short-chain dehydrogenase [Candidatus Endoriftia persephone str. Guaymas]
MKKTIIFGATSAIAQETAKILAQNGHALFLVGRNKEKLKIIADDLSVRGAHKIITSTVDINNTSEHSAIIQDAIDEMNGLDIALIAHGTLSNQKACEISYTET